MEYLVFALAVGAFIAVIFGMEAVRTKREEKNFIESLYQGCEQLREKEYKLERFARMGSFYERHKKEGQLDDITWNDLGMDEIFKRMNYTLSASGEEYLYYKLRTPEQDGRELAHLEEVVDFFGSHPEVRVRIQLVFDKLGYTGKFSLYDYLDHLDVLGERSSRKNILMDLLFLPCIGLLWVNFSVAVLGLVLLMILNIVTYFKEKGEIDPYITSFSYIMRLLKAEGELEKISVPVCGAEWERMREAAERLRGMRRNSFWVMSPFRGNAQGDIIAVVLDYVRMIFHVDLIKFNSMLRVLRGHIRDVDDLVWTVGYLETAISIWAFRESMEPEAGGNGWCVPEFTDQECIEIHGGYHPLLASPVKNGITADKGVLLTGSNASGKSTFLKTMALNAIFAQTIHTCAADSYRGAYFHVLSSMALRDDIASGESYYIVEIKALKRILDTAVNKRPVLCFVDEVLRGTNTVERIAASAQILKSLSHSGILCFAATHDIELTELLQKEFDNYHFEEDVREGDVYFNYKLKPGKATTRNAIKLLELMGYAPEIIQKASAMAEYFVESGVWQT